MSDNFDMKEVKRAINPDTLLQMQAVAEIVRKSGKCPDGIAIYLIEFEVAAMRLAVVLTEGPDALKEGGLK